LGLGVFFQGIALLGLIWVSCFILVVGVMDAVLMVLETNAAIKLDLVPSVRFGAEGGCYIVWVKGIPFDLRKVFYTATLPSYCKCSMQVLR